MDSTEDSSATAHFIYFPTGGYKLDAKGQDQIRDVAGLMQSHPDFVATILGKTDSGALKVSADCEDSISYTSRSVMIALRAPTEIIYSASGDPALATTLKKCALKGKDCRIIH